MAWSKPLTDDEKEFIRQTYPQLGTTECARRLGRSRRCVQVNARRMGLMAEARTTPAREVRGEQGPSEGAAIEPAAGGDTLSRLREARDVLHRQMLEADPKNVASIVREYRAVCKDIDAMGGGGADGSDSLADAIARALSDA